MTQPGIPNEYTLSTSCFGTRLKTIEDQAFASVAMGFRRIELGLSEHPVPLNGFEDSRRETGICVPSMVAGCLNPLSENMSGTQLGSTDSELRERALNSVRRHVRIAEEYACPIIILRGCEVEDRELGVRAGELQTRIEESDVDEAEKVAEEVNEFVSEVQKKGQPQVEHFCRSIHTLSSEFPDVKFAIEPGLHFNDILNFEAVGWTLDDLQRQGLGYWHDTGRVHLREQAGLPSQAKWLDTYASRMLGVHLQDAANNEAEIPPGMGEVDFVTVAEHLPKNAERVLEINPRHGRAEILAAIQFLAGLGF